MQVLKIYLGFMQDIYRKDCLYQGENCNTGFLILKIICTLVKY